MRSSLRTSVTVIAASLIILAASQSVFADPVAFSITGTFNNIPANSGCTGNGTNILTCSNGRQMIFTGNTFSQDVTSPVYGTPLGTFQYVNLNPSTAVGPLLPAGITFNLTINQLTPTPGIGTFLGVITIEPMVGLPFSQNVFTFNQLSLSIGEINYAVNNFYIVYTTFGSGVIVNHPVPEPATILLLGTGLAGAVGAARKRRKASH